MAKPITSSRLNTTALFFLITGINSRPYWNCHGTDRAMTFGAYVRNFGALIWVMFS